jgi:superfamily I DNA/RNA helicase
VPTGGYQAILIDEGQDFADEWYRLLLRAFDPEANRLFIAFDSSQNIYQRRVSWRILGVQIVGHTRVLRLRKEGIAAAFLPDRRADGTVGVSTIHSSKGLDAGHVLILNAHELDSLEEEEEARRLLYIAMTRARDELCVSSARPSWIVDEVGRAVRAGATP